MTAVCAAATNLFVIDRDRFFNIVSQSARTVKAIEKTILDLLEKERRASLDYVLSTRRLIHPHEGAVFGERKEQCLELQTLFKNLIMHQIVKNRETRKVPKLTDILDEHIKREQKKQQIARMKRAQISLADLNGNDEILDEGQEELITDQVTKMETILDKQDAMLDQL